MIEGKLDIERLFENDTDLSKELLECGDWILEGTVDLIDALKSIAEQGMPATGKDAAWTLNGIAEVIRIMRVDLAVEFKRLDDRLQHIAISLSGEPSDGVD